MLLEVKDTADRAATVAMLRAVEPHSIDGLTADELAEGCVLLDILEDGQTVGAFAVDIDGKDATITAGASRGEASFRALELVEQLLKRAGVERLEILTRRVGLIYRMTNAGYAVQACTMQKDI